MTYTVSPVTFAAWRVFYQWRRDVRAAGFRVLGTPAAAAHALAKVVGANTPADWRGQRQALRIARAALEEWMAGGHPGVVEANRPLADLITAELAADMPL